MKKRNLLIILLIALFTAAAPLASYFNVNADEPIEESVMVESICANTAFPAGWVVVDITAESFRCGVIGQPFPPVYNVWYIRNLNPEPNGTLVQACHSNSPPISLVPTGWGIENTAQLSFICGVSGQPFPGVTNVRYLRRLTGVTPTPTPTTPVPNQTPIGFFDEINSGTALGWGLDKDSPGINIRVHFYLDGIAGQGTFLGQVTTYIPRPDVNTATGYAGNHGFSFAIPRQYYDGTVHSLRAYALDNAGGQNPMLTGSPKNFQLFSGQPMGKFESVGADRVLRGWTLDPSNPNASNSVSFYINGPIGSGTLMGTASASIVRPDVNASTGLPGNHGYEFAVPSQYHDGLNHVVYAYGQDLGSDPQTMLQDSPKVMNYTPILISRTAYDFNGDGKADQTVFRTGAWYENLSPNNTFAGANWGLSTDSLTPADYDGDGKTDLAIFRNDTGSGQGHWWIFKSSTNTSAFVGWGLGTDKPVQADYDGDGKADVAIVRSDSGQSHWWILKSSNGQVLYTVWGLGTDTPAPGDYDGDGKTDFAVTRQTASGLIWLIQGTTSGYFGIQFGLNTDKAVQSDYDGDGKTDVAVFRDGAWYVQQSRDGFVGYSWGLSTDTPVPSDFDGDLKADLAIFRNDTGTGQGHWWIVKSSTGQSYMIVWGYGTDIPINKR